MELKKISRLSMFLALSVVLNILESFLPFFNGSIPGLRLGLANIVTLVVLFLYGFKEAITLSLFRVFLVGLLRTGLFSLPFFFSLGGVFLSTIMMAFSIKLSFSIVGVSVIGAIFHTFGQVLMAYFLMNASFLIYLPWLLFFSVISGVIIGLISKELIPFLKNTLAFP